MSPRQTLGAVALFLSSVALAAGCGSDSQGSSSQSSSSSGAGSGYGSSSSRSSSSAGGFAVEGTPVAFHGQKTFSGEGSVELDDNYFEPTLIKGKAGATVKLELENEGAREHNFTLERQHLDKDVEAGKKVVVSVKIPASGRLTFYCKYHVAKGMGGALQAGS